MSDDLTPLQNEELHAMRGDGESVMQVISGLREYRKLVAEILATHDNGIFVRMDVPDRVAEIECANVEE